MHLPAVIRRPGDEAASRRPRLHSRARYPGRSAEGTRRAPKTIEGYIEILRRMENELPRGLLAASMTLT